MISFDRPVLGVSVKHQPRTNHPCQLALRDPEVLIKVNLALYDAPEQRYCRPESTKSCATGWQSAAPDKRAELVHCMTCDITEPTQYIVWVAPQGGEGPVYLNI